MVLLRSKSESRLGALGWQLHSAPQHAHCISLQLCLGPGPTQSQKETRLEVGWITAPSGASCQAPGPSGRRAGKEEVQEGHTAAQPPTPQSSSTSSLGLCLHCLCPDLCTRGYSWGLVPSPSLSK